LGLGWIAWSGLDLMLVDLAYDGEAFRYRIEIVGWKALWPVVRWLPGWIAILISSIRAARPPCDQSRIRSCLWLVWALLALRIVSLVPGVGSVATVLGILWSGHVSWALSLSLLVYVYYPELNAALLSKSRAVGVGLLLCFGVLYLAYAVFFVRTTLLHGDETQYMMIAQSLVHDGDIDLANTTADRVSEFHELTNVYPRRAPASPEGKLHSAHPVGLGAFLVPFYWFGLVTMGHPRLACVLLIALTTALAVFLVYRWLLQQGVTTAGALLTSIGVGISPLMFLFSHQIYPEVFALVAGIAVLMALAGPLPRTYPRASAFGIALVLVALPMFHQRLLPLCVCLGLLTYVELRDLPQRLPMLKGVGAILTLGLVAYVLYHLHLSGDIWGPFKPGNSDVLDFGRLPTALFGQWLDVEVGLLNNSPIFLGSLVGVVAMTVSRDRRLLIVIGIYATTACVNALSNDWRFGYCFPSRFMVTALPALLIPLAHTMDRALRENVPLLFVLMLGGCIGWDGIREVVSLPEVGYIGGHLIHRALDEVYPVGTHFPLLLDGETVPWLDALVCVAVVTTLFLIASGSRMQRAALLVGSIVVVQVIGRVQYPDRLDGRVAPAPSLRRFTARNEQSRVYSGHQKSTLRLSNGAEQEGIHHVVRTAGGRPGVVAQGILPYVFPSVYGVTLPATALESSSDRPAGHFVVARRQSLRARSDHETRYAVPITPGKSVAFIRHVETTGKALVYQFVTYRGSADLQFGNATVVLHAETLDETDERVVSHSVDLESGPGRGLYHGFAVSGLEKGFYRAEVKVDGITPSVWLARRSDPIVLTLFQNVKDSEDGKEKALAWRPMIGQPLKTPIPDNAERPSVEAYLSPHWASVGFGRQVSIDFETDQTQTLYLCIAYSGEYEMVFKSVEVYRRSFTEVVDGSSYVLPDKRAGW
jgi:hypothetical protein